MAEENIMGVGKLYGAPFLLGHSEQRQFYAYRKSQSRAGISVTDDNLFAKNSNIFTNGTKILKDNLKNFIMSNEKVTQEWEEAYSILKSKTLEPFESEKDLKNYLKKVNENLKAIYEQDIILFIRDVLSAYNKDFQEKNIGVLYDKIQNVGITISKNKKINAKRATDKLEKILNKSADILARSLGGDKDGIRKVIKDKLLSEYFSKDTVFVTNRLGGAAGEIGDAFADTIAFTAVEGANEGVTEITEETINAIFNNMRIVGGKNNKPDLAFSKDKLITLHISVKNYPTIVEKVQKLKDDDKLSLLIQDTVTLDKIFSNVLQVYDKDLSSHNEALEKLATYWVNMAYIYRYSDAMTTEERELKNIVGKYISAFAILFLVTGLNMKENKDKLSYNQIIKNFTDSIEPYPALFFQFSQLGIIPTYELVQACKKFVKNLTKLALETDDTGLYITYYTSTPIQAVDKMNANDKDDFYGDNSNLKEKKILKSGKLDYYGTKSNILSANNNDVDAILKARFDTFVKDLKVGIHMQIFAKTLFEILNDYGIINYVSK